VCPLPDLLGVVPRAWSGSDAACRSLSPINLNRLAPKLGRSFSQELISAVSQMSQQQLDDALAQLVTAELIFRRGTPPLRFHSSPVRRLSELSLGQHRTSIRFSVAQKVIEGFFPGP
jgi:hypothetical protein